MPYQLKQNKSGGFQFNLKAANHQVILASESYDKKSSALSGIKSVQKHGGKKDNFEVRTSKSNKPYFVLKASNGEIIGTSQMYSSDRSAQNGIASVIANSSSDTIKEEEAA